MYSKIIWKWLFVFLLGWAVVIWVWVLWPQPVASSEFIFPEISSQFLISEEGSPFSIPEGEIKTTLSYPKVIHSGDKGEGTLRVSSLGDKLNADTHKPYHLIIESRLDFPLLNVIPNSGIEQTFVETRPLNFQWEIIPKEAGKFEGQLWVYILIVNEDGQIDRQAMLAVPIELVSQEFLGFSERILTWAGGLLVPVLLGIIFIIEKINNRQYILLDILII